MPWTEDFFIINRTDLNRRCNRMLDAGDVRVTVTSLKSGEHITVRFKAMAKPELRWKRVPFDEATYVWVTVPPADEDGSGWQGDRIGTWYPRKQRFYRDGNCSDARYWAALNAARWLSTPEEISGYAPSDQATYHEEGRCGHCARRLTDPVSIERGIGPTCYGRETGSRHEVKNEDQPTLLDGTSSFLDATLDMLARRGT